MDKNDDTKLRTVTPFAFSPDGSHFLAELDGKVKRGVTYEYAEEHHPEWLADPEVEIVAYSSSSSPSSKPGSGPAKVTSDNYRAGWDRIFGKRETGEA